MTPQTTTTCSDCAQDHRTRAEACRFCDFGFGDVQATGATLPRLSTTFAPAAGHKLAESRRRRSARGWILACAAVCGAIALLVISTASGSSATTAGQRPSRLTALLTPKVTLPPTVPLSDAATVARIGRQFREYCGLGRSVVDVASWKKAIDRYMPLISLIEPAVKQLIAIYRAAGTNAIYYRDSPTVRAGLAIPLRSVLAADAALLDPAQCLSPIPKLKEVTATEPAADAGPAQSEIQAALSVRQS